MYTVIHPECEGTSMLFHYQETIWTFKIYVIMTVIIVKASLMWFRVWSMSAAQTLGISLMLIDTLKYRYDGKNSWWDKASKDCQEGMTQHYNSYSHDTQILRVSLVIQSSECVSMFGPCQFGSIHTSSSMTTWRTTQCVSKSTLAGN